MKTCTKCDLEKPLIEFYKDKSKKDGYRTECKLCHKDNKKIFYFENSNTIKERVNLFYIENKDIKLEYQKEYRINNNESIKISLKNWKNKNLEYFKNYQKTYRETHKKEYNQYEKNRKLNDPLFKLTKEIRSLLNNSFKSLNLSKNDKTRNILGCSVEYFKKHLESKFEYWMTWENKGNPKDNILELNKTWDIDHIIPTSSAKTEEEIIKLNHYTNLQPLCSYTNRYIKKDKF